MDNVANLLRQLADSYEEQRAEDVKNQQDWMKYLRDRVDATEVKIDKLQDKLQRIAQILLEE